MSSIDMSNKQYLEAMENLKKYVESGAKLSGFDDDTVGDKDTQCTWGLCGDNIKVYPDPKMHLWPKEFPNRIAPKYLQEHHRCPFEDPTAKDQTNGCFYRCRYFQQRQRPSKDVWLVYWREAIGWSGLKTKSSINIQLAKV